MLKNIQKTSKKVLTKGKDCSIIAKPSRKDGTQSRDWSIGTKKTSKKVEKSFEKSIDKSKRLWYNNQARCESGERNGP